MKKGYTKPILKGKVVRKMKKTGFLANATQKAEDILRALTPVQR